MDFLKFLVQPVIIVLLWVFVVLVISMFAIKSSLRWIVKLITVNFKPDMTKEDRLASNLKKVDEIHCKLREYAFAYSK